MSTSDTLTPAIPTEDGKAWLNRYQYNKVPGGVDAIAVGTGTGDRDPTLSSLRNEVHRETITTGGSAQVIEDSGDPTIQYARIELGGGLELDAGQEITEAGVISTATDPDTLVWLYIPPASVPFPSGERNEIVIPTSLVD